MRAIASHQRSRLQALIPYAALVAAMVLISTGNALAKPLFLDVGAAGATLYRTSFAALILIAIWRPWRHAWKRTELFAIASYGAVLGALNLCFYMSLKTTPLGIAVAIEFLGPLSVALFHSRRLAHFAWVGLAVVGLGLLLPIHGLSERLDPVGIGFAMAAGAFWALYIIFGSRTADLHAGHTVALGITMAALVVAPAGIISAGDALLNPQFILLGLVVAILSCALPFSLEMIALRGIPKRTFGILAAAEPALGAVAGMVFLAEALSLLHWVAIGCIVAAGAGAVASGTGTVDTATATI